MKITCEKCGKVFSKANLEEGDKFKCPRCGNPMVVSYSSGIISDSINKVKNNAKGVKMSGEWILGVIIVIIIAVVAFSAIVIVPAGYRGVLLQYGATTGINLQQGLHFITPVVQSVVLMNVRTQLYSVSADSASQDLQEVETNVGLNYFIPPASVSYIYSQYGTDYQNVIIAPQVQEAIKATTANFTASELITERPFVQSEIQNRLTTELAKFNMTVVALAITNFSFSAQYTQAIENKVVATQQLEQQLIVLNTTRIIANQTVAAASGQARAAIVLAEGNSSALSIVAAGQANAITKVNQALNNSPDYLQYLELKQWDGAVPTTYVGNNNGGGNVPPFLLLNANNGNTINP